MSKPIIEFERIAILRKVMRVPDARFKSGFREVTTLAESSFVFPDNIDGTQLTQDHIHKFGKKMQRTSAFADISFKLRKGVFDYE